MKIYTINQEQLEKVVAYLVTRPFADVFKLINILQVLPQADISKDLKTSEIKK